MAEITMPKLSDTMTEGTLVAWKKKPGDKISSGDVIADVETDKATMEMEAFEEGVLTEIFVQEGQKVAVGEKLAIIAGEGEAAAAKAPAKKSAPTATDDTPVSKQPVPSLEKEAAKSGQALAPSAAEARAEGEGAPGSPPAAARIKASPLAKKVAAAQGVDLASLTGSGPGGRIVQKDVLAGGPTNGTQAQAPATPAGTPRPAAAPAPVAKPAVPAPAALVQPGQQIRVPLTGMRKVIADRLVESKTTIPHFYLHIEVDAAPLAKMRAEINVTNEKEGNGVKISVNDLILKAVASAIAKNPKVNASFTGDSVTEFSSVQLAVAVAIDEGLITPVIKDANYKSLSEISLSVKDLAARAKNKKLKPEEYQGGTFTVSNLGAYGIDRFDAIINPPQAGILSVGAMVKKPVVNAAGELAVGQRIDLGLSCDHRVIDGAVGATFLASLKHLLENPLLLLL